MDGGSRNRSLGSRWRDWRRRRSPVVGPPRLRFAAFELETDTGRLWRGGEAVHIQPQPARALQHLAERSGELVTRDELRRLLWGEGHFVDFDQGLNYCIQQIRLALGDSAQAPRYVETLPRRGYRFLAPVERASASGPLRSSPTGGRRLVARWVLVALLIAAAAALAFG